MKTIESILVLCTGNSCRSQIAEGYLRHFGIAKVVYSAGIETHGLNPKAVEVMAMDGIDISKQASTNISEYLSQDFDLILTVCDHAAENCPYFPSSAQRIHQRFPDPAKAKGTENEILAAFVEVRDEIKKFCLSLKLLS